MTGLFGRIGSKLSRLWFTATERPRLKHLGPNGFLFSPYRIDGAAGISIGKNSVLQRGGWLFCADDGPVAAALTIGEGCVFGYNNHVTAVDNVHIGNHVLTANNVYISDNLHGYEDISRPIMHQPVRLKGRVEIGDGCWLGENVAVIGARIGKNCVIGANAVVTRDIPDYSVAVGIPARVIKQYDTASGTWRRIATEAPPPAQ
jgi:acetyltransferase-like isoleucine patch superfamily enzyme